MQVQSVSRRLRGRQGESACRVYTVIIYCMEKLTRIPATIFVGLFFLAACSSTGKAVTPTVATASPQPTATEITALPTPASPGDSITWRNLQVTMDQIEITGEYVNEFGSTRSPSPGKNFMWAHIQLINEGQIEIDTPRLENFSVLYAGAELKPIYGYRRGYKDYSTLTPKIFPDQEADGWLRFDIPAAAELKDMLCVFLPESTQVGTSFSSPMYPYSENKPAFVWKCAL
jgi:hypothetical protein